MKLELPQGMFADKKNMIIAIAVVVVIVGVVAWLLVGQFGGGGSETATAPSAIPPGAPGGPPAPGGAPPSNPSGAPPPGAPGAPVCCPDLVLRLRRRRRLHPHLAGLRQQALRPVPHRLIRLCLLSLARPDKARPRARQALPGL